MFYYNPIINCFIILLCIVLMVIIILDFNPFRKHIKVSENIMEYFTGDSFKLLKDTDPNNPLKKHKN